MRGLPTEHKLDTYEGRQVTHTKRPDYGCAVHFAEAVVDRDFQGRFGGFGVTDLNVVPGRVVCESKNNRRAV